jgi:dipeptidyl aminopeptidase/acylaminoacyl peptidase
MRITLVFLLVSFFCLSPPALSQEPEIPRYQLPPQVMIDLVDAPETPEVLPSPDREKLLVLQREGLPTIDELAEPELRLAGIRIDPRRYAPSRTEYNGDPSLLSIADGSEVRLTGLPVKARIHAVSWSADSRYLALSVVGEAEVTLWVAETRTAKARLIPGIRLNAALPERPFQWVAGRHELVCRTVPADAGPVPKAPVTPTGPDIQETAASQAPARTYQDLIENADDEALFEHYAASQLVRVTIKGDITKLGEPGLYTDVEASPDGNYLLVKEVLRPFSRLVRLERFPRRTQLWDREGRAVRELAALPAAEKVPIGNDAVPQGPRSFGWRADAAATVYWTEARDAGDPNKNAEVRDEVLTLEAPFSDEPTSLFKGGFRVDEIDWGNTNVALLTESWWKTRQEKVWILRPNESQQEPRLLFDRLYEDRYGDPGDPVKRPNQNGQSVLLAGDDGSSLLYVGQGASPEGDRPFVDRRNLNSGATDRVWHSTGPYYEFPVAPLDDEASVLLTRRESAKEPPNYFVLNTKTGVRRQLTHVPHPSPQLKDASKELIRYKRDDGVDLSATLYLPPGYRREQGRLPLLVWAYPREYKTAAAASQVVGSPHRFTRVAGNSPLFWLTQGFAVLDGATMPILGEGDKQPNDSYVQQLVGSAKAAVDEAVRRGVADRERAAIAGHSYGAFMTANLLAHSDVFRAGIAQSGAYNRSLTPFGFQSEERTFWEAPEIYFAMSPFMHAHKANEPILLIHGAADNNAGTFPIQSERFYHALKGHGATARLVMLPHESHGYRARESVLHVLWEKTRWLDRYVKNAAPRPDGVVEARIKTP